MKNPILTFLFCFVLAFAQAGQNVQYDTINGITIAHVSKAALGTGVLTPTTANGFATVTFTNAGDSVTLQYFSVGGWVIIASRGVTIA